MIAVVDLIKMSWFFSIEPHFCIPAFCRNRSFFFKTLNFSSVNSVVVSELFPQWLIWVSDWPVDYCAGWCGQSSGWLTWLTDWLTTVQADVDKAVVDWLHWLTGWLLCRLMWTKQWLTGLTGWLLCRLMWTRQWLIDLTDWLVDYWLLCRLMWTRQWLIDWLTGWLLCRLMWTRQWLIDFDWLTGWLLCRLMWTRQWQQPRKPSSWGHHGDGWMPATVVNCCTSLLIW